VLTQLWRPLSTLPLQLLLLREGVIYDH
jgi:hypothetical protein